MKSTLKKYGDALTAFEESYRLYPHHSTLFNLGMCHKALGSCREVCLAKL